MYTELTTKEEILLAVSISMGALFVATMLTLIIARYSKRIHECCLKWLSCLEEDQEKSEINENIIKPKSSKVPLMLLGTDENQFIIPGSIVYDKVQPEFRKKRSESLAKNSVEGTDRLKSSCFVDKGGALDISESDRKARSTSFGKLRSKSVDLVSKSSLTRAFSDMANKASAEQKRSRSERSFEGRHSSFGLGGKSEENRRRMRVQKLQKQTSTHFKDVNPFMLRRNAFSKSESYLNAPVQVGQITPELYNRASGVSSDASVEQEEEEFDASTILLPARGFLSTGSSPMNSDDESDKPRSMLELRPELYDMSRKKSVGFGTLGKIKISLQYLDHDRTKLELFIHYMDQLQIRPGVMGIFATVVLLPDRETIYKTKMHQATRSPLFEQSFVFNKTRPADVFSTRTIRFQIYNSLGHERHDIYGESEYSMARSEIFGKVKTDNVLNINPPSSSSEVGDILVEIFYTYSDAFHVLVRTLKLSPSTSIEHMSALQVKACIKKRRRKVGDTVTVTCPTPNEKEAYVPVSADIKQTIPRELFAEYSLHITVNGKHKLLGKSIKIGKTILGNNALTQADNLHWMAIMNSPGMQYNLWHVMHAC